MYVSLGGFSIGLSEFRLLCLDRLGLILLLWLGRLLFSGFFCWLSLRFLLLLLSLTIIGSWELFFIVGLAHDALFLVHEPGVAHASLVVVAVVQGVSGGESHKVA